MADTLRESIAYRRAKKRMKKIKGFYIHLSVFLVVNLALIIFDVVNSGFTYNLTEISLYNSPFLWGIGIAAHWANVFGANLIFSADWEERKIRGILKGKEKSTWK